MFYMFWDANLCFLACFIDFPIKICVLLNVVYNFQWNNYFPIYIYILKLAVVTHVAQIPLTYLGELKEAGVSDDLYTCITKLL